MVVTTASAEGHVVPDRAVLGHVVLGHVVPGHVMASHPLDRDVDDMTATIGAQLDLVIQARRDRGGTHTKRMMVTDIATEAQSALIGTKVQLILTDLCMTMKTKETDVTDVRGVLRGRIVATAMQLMMMIEWLIVMSVKMRRTYPKAAFLVLRGQKGLHPMLVVRHEPELQLSRLKNTTQPAQ